MRKSYIKKIIKENERHSEHIQRMISKWGYYIDNSERNSYKDLNFKFKFNYEFNAEETKKFANTFIFTIPSIYDIDFDKDNFENILDDAQLETTINKCFFNEAPEDLPFYKIGRLDSIKKYYENFPTFYRDILDIFIKNNELLNSRFKEVKKDISLLDRSRSKQYVRILQKYNKYNDKVCRKFLRCLIKSYLECNYMYTFIASFTKGLIGAQ